jgi:dihydroorotase
VVRGGRIVDGNGLSARTVAVRDGSIAALLSPMEAVKAKNVIDVDGCIVLPGLVDAHVHFRDPGLTHKEDFDSGSRAAAAGGVTTVMVMPTDKPFTQTADQFAEKRALAEGRSHVDFALQALLGPDFANVAALAAQGAVSFEIFMGLLEPKIDDDDTLAAALAAVRAAGGVAGVTPLVEARDVARAIAAHRRSGGRMHLRQISSAAGVEAMHGAAPGLTSEVTPHNLWLTEAAFAQLGAIAKVFPPLRPQADVDAVRKALKDGRISMVATDHAPHAPEEKAAGLERAPGGFPGVQTLLPLLLKLVEDGVLDYSDVVRVACEAPARAFGVYPRKGTLRAGADADLAVVDPARPMHIRDEAQESKARHTPFNGWKAPATPVLTLLRGQVIAREGKVVSRPVGLHLKPGRMS